VELKYFNVHKLQMFFLNFSLRHHVLTGSGAQPASYPTGTGDYFPGDKASEA